MPPGTWPPAATLAKADLRRLCRRRRRQALPAAAAGILAVASNELPSLLARRGAAGALLAPGRRGGSAIPGRPTGLEDRCGPAGDPALPAAWCIGPGAPAWPWSPTTAASPPRRGRRGGEALPAEGLALLLVPALAVDATGLRLGSGGGFYDRLRADPAWRAVPALAVLPAACVVPRLPGDPWDVPFDGWLDETGLHRSGRFVTRLQSCNDPPFEAPEPRGFVRIARPACPPLGHHLRLPSPASVAAPSTTARGAMGNDAPARSAPLTAAERILAAEMRCRGKASDALSMMVSSVARMVQVGKSCDSRWKAS
jgi:5-formyltetrahydrofolate cyclo-ligase